MTVSVLPGDIDEQNHVNNTVYLRWVQDVATAHWRAVASPEAQESYRLGRYPTRDRLQDSRRASGTRSSCAPGSAKPLGLRFERFTEIRRNGDGQLLSKAATLWCPINAQTGRLTRVPAEVRAQFST